MSSIPLGRHHRPGLAAAWACWNGCSHWPNRSGSRLRIELIDPVGDGAGVHSKTQPDYLLLNTICSQVSMFPDRALGRRHRSADRAVAARVGAGTGPADRRRRLQRRPGRPAHRAVGLPAPPAAGGVPRLVRRDVLGTLPAGVEVRLHRSAAIGLRGGDAAGQHGSEAVAGRPGRGPSASSWHPADGCRRTRPSSPPAIPTTSPAEQPNHRLIGRPYPMPDRLSKVLPGQTVAIGGFGLTAMDAMSCLTVGRGGRFDAPRRRLRYLPSGEEPRLLFYSRSGRACRARPRILRYGPAYRPLVFTPARHRPAPGGDRWRAGLRPAGVAVGVGQSCGSPTGGPRPGRPDRTTAGRLERRLVDGRPAGGGLTRCSTRWTPSSAGSEPEVLLDGRQPMSLTDPAGYQGWLAAELAADLAEGELGLQGSIVKQTLDILRELRDTFRHAVDFGGLTPESAAGSSGRPCRCSTAPWSGHSSNGIEELLALIEARHGGGAVRAEPGDQPGIRRPKSWLMRIAPAGQPAC